VAVPYEDGVQKLLAERYGPGPIEDIIDDITFERLYTALAAEKIARLVALEGSATRATKATGSTAGSPSTHRAACDPRS
jgi:hypothetical protein